MSYNPSGLINLGHLKSAMRKAQAYTAEVASAAAEAIEELEGMLPSNASSSKAGLMTAEQYSKLAGIAAGANKTIVDSAMSSSSANPVENRVVAARIAGVEALLGGLTLSINQNDGGLDISIGE